MNSLTFQRRTERTCPVCGSVLLPQDMDTWFFVGSPEDCRYVCSRECLVKYVGTLPDRPALPRMGKIKVLHCPPHRRE